MQVSDPQGTCEPIRLSRPRGTDEPIRLLIVDDHAVLRLGLVTLFARERNINVVGEAAGVQEALAATAETNPEVVLMDVRLMDGTGIDACREIRAKYPHIKVVMLSAFSDSETVIAAILAGANGYLLKGGRTERMIEGVETAALGGALLDDGVTESVLSWMRSGGQRETGPLAGLSDQERRILPLIALGKTNREIGAMLFLSEHTVKTYVSALLRKLQLARRSEAAAYVARHEPLPQAGVAVDQVEPRLAENGSDTATLLPLRPRTRGA